MTKPAMASPLGFLKMPANEKIRPNTQTIQPNTGTTPRNRAMIARTKPAVPKPFFWFLFD